MQDRDFVITSDTGRQYRVCELISTGTGQGDVYRVQEGDTVYALKLFHGEDHRALRRQIEILLRRGRACPAFVHPLDIVCHEGRVGYVMEFVPDRFLSGNTLYNGVEQEGCFCELPFNVRLSVLYNIAEALAVSYEANLAMMDLKFDNLKFDPDTCEVRIIDTDTIVCSENGKGLIEGTVGFMPPLTMQRLERPDKHNDAFALGVMIFMSLIGAHPLMGSAENNARDCDIETYLLAEHPVYIWHPFDKSNRPTPEQARAACKLGRYPGYFLQAMERTFVEGLYDGEKRTSPTDWCEILQRLYRDSFCCCECGEEQFLSSSQSCCDNCGSPLIRPLLLQADHTVPLFFGATVTRADLWQGGDHKRALLRVAATPYRGKCGLLVEGDGCLLHLVSGKTVRFERGQVMPLFLNATYETENKRFIIKEGL